MNPKAILPLEDPQAILTFLRVDGRLSARKARLFAVACCRRIWPWLTDERSRKAVQVAEAFADGLATAQDLDAAATDAAPAGHFSSDQEYASQVAALAACSDDPILAAEDAADWASRAGAGMHAERSLAWVAALNAERLQQAALLRDIFGPLPGRPPAILSPAVQAWNDGCIPKLAAGVYEVCVTHDGRLGAVRLGILADALEDAAVTDAGLLDHLRGPAVHVKGCWVIDLLVSKG